MRLGSLGYLAKQGWKGMAANRLMTLASIGVLTACLIITGIASLVSLNVNNIVDYLGSQNEIRVYILDTDEAGNPTSPETIAALGDNIRALPNVAEVVFNSKEDAYAQMQEWMENYGDLMSGLDDVLPASYRVTVQDLSLIDETSARLAVLPGVESVSTPTELAGVMVTIKTAVTYGGWALVAILGIVSIIIISNTIRLTVFARRREISIMKYVGATNMFIRLPFFVEGMTVGAVAGLLASGAVCGGYYLVLRYIQDSKNLWVLSITANILPLQQLWYWIVISFVLFGIIIGGLGTSNSMRKHLKV